MRKKAIAQNIPEENIIWSQEYACSQYKCGLCVGAFFVSNENFHSIPRLDIADVSYYLPHFGQMRLAHVSGEAISFHSLWLKVTLHWGPCTGVTWSENLLKCVRMFLRASVG